MLFYGAGGHSKWGYVDKLILALHGQSRAIRHHLLLENSTERLAVGRAFA